MVEDIILYILAFIGLCTLAILIIILMVYYTNETNKYNFDKYRKQWLIKQVMKLDINRPLEIYKLVKKLGFEDIKFLSKYSEKFDNEIGEKINIILDYSLIFKEGEFE